MAVIYASSMLHFPQIGKIFRHLFAVFYSHSVLLPGQISYNF